MSTSLLSLRSRISGQIKSVPAFPPKRLHIQAFRDYQSITPKEDEPVNPSFLFKSDCRNIHFARKSINRYENTTDT